ncbi:hypothetical protein CTEN210_16712 [Chaetoceros tenuissimus]|uniref:Uncharacterized protein n=1 Tax=Chaetoceros tenuissimus TaxID=426638 RepID=A0AAD3D9A6_9STRA|nr:hypothetical protein CTEN210_16712 [Chaetoceros tenuissimus]
MDRVKRELKLSFFSEKDANEKQVDMMRTFQPNPKPIVLVWKLAMIGIAIANAHYSISSSRDPKALWLGYLTRWNIMLSWLYFLLSLASFFFPRTSVSEDSAMPSLWKFSWITFTSTINVSVFVTVMFWVLVFDGKKQHLSSIYEHALVLVLAALDGFIIHRFPIRLKQIAGVYAVLIAYLIWTIIHSQTGIGNGYEYSDGFDDDALYSDLNWNKRIGGAIVLVVLVIFIELPLIFILLWLLSLVIPHHYIEEGEEREGTVNC